jgi:hypothetical protein
MNPIGPAAGRPTFNALEESATTTTTSLPTSTSTSTATSTAAASNGPAAGTRPARGEAVEAYPDNGFTFRHSAGHVEAQGSVAAQLWSGAVFAQQSAMAEVHLRSGGRFPSREDIQAVLGSLGLQPVDKDAPISTADYDSHVKGAPPDAVFAAFVNEPRRFFQAAGLSARPGVDGLRDGARFFLEEKGPPAVWAPVEVRLDPEGHRVRLNCLDGHPLRGHNEFHFAPDGQGGTLVRQRSVFQGNFLPVTALGTHVLGIEERQKEIWQRVHGELARVRP